MYKSPAPDDLRSFMARHDLSGSRLGKLCSVEGRTVRRWLAPVDVDGHWDMPGPLWALVRLLFEEVTPEQLLAEFDA